MEKRPGGRILRETVKFQRFSSTCVFSSGQIFRSVPLLRSFRKVSGHSPEKTTPPGDF